MEKVILEVKLNAEDIYQVSEYMRQYNESASKENQKFFFFSIGAFVVVFGLFALSPRFTIWEAFLPSIIIVGGLIAVSAVFSFLSRTTLTFFYKRWLQKTFAKRQSTPNISDKTLYLFDGAGVEVIYGVTKNSGFWTGLGVIEMPIAYLLVNRSNQVEAIFPKRCFMDVAHEVAFRTLIKKQLGDKARLELTSGKE